VIVDIYDELFDNLKRTITDATFLQTYNEEALEYPLVVVSEKSNTDEVGTKDSSGYNHCLLMFQIDIFSTGDSKVSISKGIRNQVDAIMSGQYGMAREFSDEVPNFLDRSIYRYTMRYVCKIDENEVIYGR